MRRADASTGSTRPQRPLGSRLLALIAAAFVLAGCASTQVETTGTPLAQPLCLESRPPVNTLVYWGTAWRPDQKEPQLREAAALRGIEQFLGRASCLAVTAVHHLSTAQAQWSNVDLLQLASGTTPSPDRVLLVVVRELGPRLLIGVPVLVEGGTEVRVDVRVIDGRTAASLVATQTLWRHGGPFVIKGVQTLDRDLAEALGTTLLPPAAAGAK